MTHTPIRNWTAGPWRLVDEGDKLVLRMGDAIRTPHDHDAANSIALYNLSYFGTNHARHCRANALLIAAAPVLYDALERLLDLAYSLTGATCEDYAAIADAQDALTKANA